MQKDTQMAWQTRLGFYLASIGAACGLGNVWRFPYVVSENGGGAFVLLYVFLVLLIGLPLIIAELMLGKVSGKSMVSAIDGIKAKKADVASRRPFLRLSPWMSRMSLVVCLFILSYFSVISGWVLFFLVRFLMAIFFGPLDPNESLQILLNTGWLQIVLTSVHLLLVVIIIAKDVDQGIEKWVGVVMPVFVVLLLGLATRNIMVEPTREALRFFFYPNFTHLKLSSLGAAVGQVCFTLTLGFGTMVTFGSYMRQKFYVPESGFRVAVFDLLISLFAGLLIFPLAYMDGSPKMGPELMFEAVPRLFTWIRGGNIFGFFFFLCLYLASLGASIAILETVVANLQDSDGLKRGRAAWGLGGLSLIGAMFPALGSTLFKRIQYNNRGLLELLDNTMVNWLLPILALIIGQFVIYEISGKSKREEFMMGGGPTADKLYGHWLFIMKYVVPTLIVAGLILQSI